MNFEVETDAGCDYECMIWEPHQHITVIDRTPPSELKQEMARMRGEIRRQRIEAGELRPGIFEALFDLSPLDTPFLSMVGKTTAAPADEVGKFPSPAMFTFWKNEEE